MSFLAILGRTPALSIAELEALYGGEVVQPVGNIAVLLDVDEEILNPCRLGGTLKLGKVWTILNSDQWDKAAQYILKELPGDWQQVVGGKLIFGLSVYGFNVKPSQINAIALSFKKALKNANCPTGVRVVPNKESALSTAQTFHNRLTGPKGVELAVIKDGSRTIIAQINWVQNIDAYAARDQARPMRDARVGMLPPKLAQIIINLANGQIKSHESRVMSILDPFCGTGVLLQEAALMGFGAHGADIDPRMVEFSIKNVMEWLPAHFADIPKISVQIADATSAQWEDSKFGSKRDDVKRIPLTFDTIACETYLGRPLSSLPDGQTLYKIIQDCNTIHKKFLQNVARQTSKGFRMCIAVPAWNTRNGFKHMPILDSLEELGYNRVSFVHAVTPDLIYYRENQIVARELVVLVRK